MTRFEKWSVWGTTLLVAATGIAFGWTKYLTASSEPFSVINHPLQPVFLKLHILVAPLFLFAIGMVAVRHIWKHFRTGTRWSRKSGMTAGLSLVPMVASGYLIQVLTQAAWLEAMAIAHIALGLLYTVGIGLHQWFLTRSPPRRDAGGRRDHERGGRAAPDDARRRRRPAHRRDRSTTGVAVALWLCAGSLAACGTADDEETAAGGTADRPPAAEGPAPQVFPGTPAGGLETWIADIGAGLEGLPLRARLHPDSAEREVLSLYLSRQEYIERYYGAGGPRAGGDALAAAVRAAEASFHELMGMTGSAGPADSAALAAAAAELRNRLEAVAREARAAGVPLHAPMGVSGTDGGGAEASEGRDAGASLPSEPGDASGANGETGLPARLDALQAGLDRVERSASNGGEARRLVVRLYLDHYEPIEGFYGPGGPYAAPGLAERVTSGEEAFHTLMRDGREEVGPAVRRLRDRLEAIRVAAREAGVPLRPDPAALQGGPRAAAGAAARGGYDRAGADVRDGGARSPEVVTIVRALRAAETAYAAGDTARALAGVEAAYLDGFEPLEPRLPSARVRRIEGLFHLHLRPLIARGAPGEEVATTFSSVYAELAAADAALEAGTPFWFGAFNAFAIILREGLEAALLIAAILAYLAKVSAADRHRRQVWAGVWTGVGASLATWWMARSLIPVGGASRELIEGVTALLAVGVLVYVSHWLFHKTYVHGWKEYLTERVGGAVTAGSAFAMAALAFAAVYREGFETVLFYQALAFDAGAGALLAGFVPGLLLIVGLGAGIIRLGLRLPIRKAFGATNAILLYLAFVFLGKGVYNLQEAGLFAPRPLGWIPDHEAARQLLGIYPVAETVALQAAFLVLVVGSYAYYRRRGTRRQAGRAIERAGAGRGRERAGASAGPVAPEGGH